MDDLSAHVSVISIVNGILIMILVNLGHTVQGGGAPHGGGIVQDGGVALVGDGDDLAGVDPVGVDQEWVDPVWEWVDPVWEWVDLEWVDLVWVWVDLVWVWVWVDLVWEWVWVGDDSKIFDILIFINII